jgi:hypothetical protein
MEQEVIKYSPFNPQTVDILLMPYYNSIFLLHIHNGMYFIKENTHWSRILITKL